MDQDINEGMQKELSNKKIDQFFIANIIDALLNKLKTGYMADFFESNQKWLVKTGLYGMYVSAVLGLICSVAFPIMYDKIQWGISLAVGGGFFVFCIVAHYLAVKFLPSVDALLKSTPSSMGSRAFLDSFAFLFVVSGVFSLVCGLVIAIASDSFYSFILGVFGFIFFEYLVSLCLKPELLNITIDENASAATELLGLLSFAVKASLKLVPIAFGSSVIFGLIYMLGLMLADYQYLFEIEADVFQVGLVYVGVLSPILGYLSFLIYYFLIDLAMAVLSLSKK